MSRARDIFLKRDGQDRYRDLCPEAVIPDQLSEVEKRLKSPLGTKSVVMNALMLSRNLSTNVITITTTPRLIVSPPHYWPYMLSNPSLMAGLTSSTQVASGIANASGNTQTAYSGPPITSLGPLGCANYLKSHFYLDVTAVTGAWDFMLQSRDPVTGKWANVQTMYSVNAVGTYYASTGEYGVVADIAIAWNPTAAGAITFSLATTLKDGTMGGSSGLSRAIFIGGQDVTTDTGYPLFEGQDKTIYFGEDVEMWAVSFTNTNLKVFRL